MVKFIGNFLRGAGITMVLLGIASTTQSLVADDPGGVAIGVCKGKQCSITCDSIQQTSGICHGLVCATIPTADCGACVCGESPLGGMFYCLCRK
jgi:hypothetical protein